MSHAFTPLASLLRPNHLSEYVGQEHLLGEQGPINNMLQQGHCYSMILWGPPGTGKTSLAHLIAKQLDATVIILSAINSGVKDIREAVNIASKEDLLAKPTMVFVDEIHRFNKSQQDAFLPFVESGQITLIGATTENPSFSVNRALLSRTRVFVLEALTEQHLSGLLNKALLHIEAQKGLALRFAQGAKQALIDSAQGDARRLLSSFEIAVDLSHSQGQIDLAMVAQATGVKTLAFDKNGDHFYDLLSAFHKSVRGSSADAALYWFVRLLKSGGDPLVIARRLLAIASEDIGNADPRALQVCINSWDLYHRVGAAEGERALAQAVIYCALAPKSNAVYKAFKQACKDVDELPSYEVPAHLRNAPTSLAKEMGHGESYRYAHNEDNAYAAGEVYLPEALQGREYYQPEDRGLEKQLKEKLAYLRHLDAQSPHKRY